MRYLQIKFDITENVLTFLMKRFFGFLLMLLTVVAVSAKDIKTVILTTNPELECGKCENKVKENLRFVKGVKDIQASAETQKITVVYDADKTTVEKIQKSLEKIGYKTRLTTKEEVIKEGCHSNCCDGK